jgi:hypothetical protein
LLLTVCLIAIPFTSRSAAFQEASQARTSSSIPHAASGDAKSRLAAAAQFRTPQRSGEIQLLPGPAPMHDGKILPLLYSGELDQADQSITTGELWSFFQHQGLEKVESIVLFLDVNKFEEPDSITIKSIEFRIEPINATMPVTTSALSANDQLVIPGYDSLSNLPEARLEIPLEFDFMQRFTAASRDRVFLKIAYDAPVGNAPNFFVAGQQSLITLPSFGLLVGFIAFCGILFYALARMTLKATPAAANDRRSS